MIYHTIKDNKPFDKVCEADFCGAWDIVVVGTGTAGAVAAICAAQQKGLSVLAIDKATMPGGVAVASGVWAYYFGQHGGLSVKINEEAAELIKNHGYADYTRDKSETNVCIPSAPKAVAIEKKIKKTGCSFWADSIVTGVYTEQGKVTGLEILCGNEMRRIGCRSVIDSADGEVCRLAGCKIENGRASDGVTMRFSKCIGRIVNNGVRGEWANFGYIDNLPEREYSKQIMRISCAQPCLKERYDADSAVIFEGSIICRREVRSVVTKHTYTLDDYFNNKSVEYPVFYACSHMDNSNPDMELENEHVQDWQVIINALTYGVGVGVDMDCLIAAEFENLFVAGKHIGVGHDMVGFIRMKADMERCGEAAALMAAEYVTAGCVRYDSIKPALVSHGILNDGDVIKLAMINETENGGYKRAYMPKNTNEVLAALSGQSPELGLLYTKTHAFDKDLADALDQGLASENTILRHNCAVALGLINRGECIDVLREILRAPAYILHHCDYKPYHYDWLNDTYHCNMLKAICLLTRFGDTQSVGIIKEICADGAKKVTEELPDSVRENFRGQIYGFAKHFLQTVR